MRTSAASPIALILVGLAAGFRVSAGPSPSPVRRVALPFVPAALAPAHHGDDVWIGGAAPSLTRGEIARVDKSGTVRWIRRLPSPAVSVSDAGSSVWVALGNPASPSPGPGLFHLAQGSVHAVSLPREVMAPSAVVALPSGGAWTLSGGGSEFTVARLDPEGRPVSERTYVGVATLLAATSTRAYVAYRVRDGFVVAAVDQTAHEVFASRRLAGVPYALTYGGHSVWIAAAVPSPSGSRTTIERLSGTRVRVVATVKSAVSIAYDRELYLASTNGNVLRLDPARGTARSIGRVPAGVVDMAPTAHTIWVAVRNARAVYQLSLGNG